MVMYTKEIGATIRPTVMVFTPIWMVRSIKASGLRINRMARAKRHGQMVQCIKVTI